MTGPQIYYRPYPPLKQGADDDLPEVPARNRQAVRIHQEQEPALPLPQLRCDLHRQPSEAARTSHHGHRPSRDGVFATDPRG